MGSVVRRHARPLALAPALAAADQSDCGSQFASWASVAASTGTALSTGHAQTRRDARRESAQGPTPGTRRGSRSPSSRHPSRAIDVSGGWTGSCGSKAVVGAVVQPSKRPRSSTDRQSRLARDRAAKVLAVMAPVAEDVRVGVTHLGRTRDLRGVIAILKHSPRAAERPIDPECQLPPEAVHAGRPRGVVGGLRDQVQVVVLHRDLQRAEAGLASRARHGLADRRQHRLGAEARNVGLRSQHDVQRVPLAVQRLPSVRRIAARLVALATRAVALATPGARRRIECQLTRQSHWISCLYDNKPSNRLNTCASRHDTECYVSRRLAPRRIRPTRDRGTEQPAEFKIAKDRSRSTTSPSGAHGLRVGCGE